MQAEERDEQQPEELGMTLTDWYRAGQRKDAVLTMAEWEHALREPGGCSEKLEGSAPLSPEGIVWRTESSVCNFGPACQCLFCEVLRTHSLPVMPCSGWPGNMSRGI